MEIWIVIGIFAFLVFIAGLVMLFLPITKKNRCYYTYCWDACYCELHYWCRFEP